MNPKHVTNLDLSKALFEAGITKDYESEFYWTEDVTATPLENGFTEVRKNGTWVTVQGKFMDRVDLRNGPEFPALLLSELLELMPKEIDGFDFLTLEYFTGDKLAKAGWETYYENVRGEDTAMLGGRYFKESSALEALSSLATYLLREGKFNKPTTK